MAQPHPHDLQSSGGNLGMRQRSLDAGQVDELQAFLAPSFAERDAGKP